MSLEIWTDGACSPNPGKGGWGWHSSDGQSQHGGSSYTTNNRMEMLAIVMALKQIPSGTRLTVYSDSRYCIRGLNEWRQGWKARGWKKKNGEPVSNDDLWIELDRHASRLKVDFQWVKGHSTNAGNIEADRLAVLGRRMIEDYDAEPVIEEPAHQQELVEQPDELEAMFKRCEHLEERVRTLEDTVYHLQQQMQLRYSLTETT